MPILVPLVIALLFPFSALAQESFDGAWTSSICAKGKSRKAGECSTFVLELMERDGKLCGTHMYATPGAERIDEGAAPSLTADIEGGNASGVAISNLATPVRMKVELRLDGRALRWEREEEPGGETLLPRKARLTRSGKPTLLAPLFAQELRAACTYVFNVAAAQSAPPIPGSRGHAAPAVPPPGILP